MECRESQVEPTGAEAQIEKLANYIMAEWPDYITEGGAGDVAIDILKQFENLQ